MIKQTRTQVGSQPISNLKQPLVESGKPSPMALMSDSSKLTASEHTLDRECVGQILALMMSSTSEFLRRSVKQCYFLPVSPRVPRERPIRTASCGVNGRALRQIDAHFLYLGEIAALPRLDSADESRIVKQMKRGDSQALETLIKAHLGLVVMFARRYQRPGVDLLDLISEGNLGLFVAAERFDHTRGLRFSTYAKWWIKRAMLLALKDLNSVVRIPVSRSDCRDKATHSLEPFWDEDESNKSVHPVFSNGDLDAGVTTSEDPLSVWLTFPREGMSSNPRLSSPSAYTDQDGVDEIAGPDNEEPSEILLSKQISKVLHQALDSLPERERRVICRRFAIGDEQEKPATLDILSRETGLSKERVRQIESAGLLKLRALLITSHVDAASHG